MTSTDRTTDSLARGTCLLVIGLALLCLWAPNADAAEPKTLWQKCPPGSAAGQCLNARGLAVHSSSGHIYVADTGNNRINEFDAWGQFVKAWGWGVVNGSGEAQVCGPGATPPTAICQKGLLGTGSGQFTGSRGAGVSATEFGSIAVDSGGSVYAFEARFCTGSPSNGCAQIPPPNRVQKFGPDGSFVLMFGREVNLTKVAERKEQEANSEPITITPQQENVCTAVSGDTCGPGVEGDGDGEFGGGTLFPQEEPTGNIAIGATDNVYVGGQERIQVFSPAGLFLESIPTPGEAVSALSVDPAGSLYVRYRDKDNVFKLDPAGDPVCTATVQQPDIVVTDSEGSLYVTSGPGGLTIRKFASDCVEDTAFAFTASGFEGLFSGVGGIATSVACGIAGDALYLTNATYNPSFLRAYYPAPDPEVCPPPPKAPDIESQYAISVGTKSAQIRAEINPRFWPDTTYYVQHGTEDCRQSPTACEKTVLAPGALLAGNDDVSVKTAAVTLPNLKPDTVYHFRFIAESPGGGPVFGVDPDGAEGPGEAGVAEGLSGTFTTFPPSLAAKLDCPNQSTRYGLSARLPDCRAYEMVSPVDKEGGDVNVPQELIHRRARYLQSSLDGNGLTYSSWKSFGGQPSSLYANQYLARRNPGGWSSQGVNPPQLGTLLDSFLYTTYQAFTPDLSSGWPISVSEEPLTSDAMVGYTNIYRRDNQTGAFEALTNAAPLVPITPSLGSDGEPSLRLQGYSADLRHQVFVSYAALTPAAATDGTLQVYDLNDGVLASVNVLPNGTTAAGPSFVGAAYSGAGGGDKRQEQIERAVSVDGSRIYWSNQGRVYVRVNQQETIPVSQSVGAQSASYWSASADGSKALFEFVGGARQDDLYLFDLASESSSLIAGGVTGVLGTSEDLSHFYFISEEALDEGAVVGANNLYVHHDGQTTYIAGLSSTDVSNDPRPAYRLGGSQIARASRITPDGRHLAFQSTASLTGFDNIDADRGTPAVEVFLYDADAEVLRCVSCNATGSRPNGREMIEPQADARFGDRMGVWAAAWIPGSEWVLNTSRLLSADGRYLFFNSYDALLPRDTNNAMDVYEWEEGESQAQCEALGAELFLKKEGGCLSLISTGESPDDSEFGDASQDGSNVFFKTDSGLDERDPGGADFYNARVGGGFPRKAPPSPCVGDACQQVPPSPSDATPASAAFRGAGSASSRCRGSARLVRQLSKRARRLTRTAGRVSEPSRASALRKQARRVLTLAKRRSRATQRCRRARANAKPRSAG